MSLQAAVERQHFLKRCNTNALVNSVMQTWTDGHLDYSITKVFRRLKPVLCNILEAKEQCLAPSNSPTRKRSSRGSHWTRSKW